MSLFQTLCRWRGTVLPAAFRRLEFWSLLGLHVGVYYFNIRTKRDKITDPADGTAWESRIDQSPLTMEGLGLLISALTFFTVTLKKRCPNVASTNFKTK